MVVLIQVIPLMPLLDTSLGCVIPPAIGAVQLPIPVRGISVIFLFPPSLHQCDRRYRSRNGQAVGWGGGSRRATEAEGSHC
ncbi:MAG TPA: hypothetical protein VGZ72_13685 [Stellaceae bacterium]|nr:hypothetical protein [Stellaceae bacterium]